MSEGATDANLLQHLQRLLERIYDIDAGYQVTDFLITDRRHAAILDEDGRVNREKLLVACSPEGVDVSLFVDAEILAKLTRDDPFRSLTDANLGDFCTAVEGVSHFTYLAWNAGHDKRVTLLELELQAEVDKFIAAAVLLKRQNTGRLPAALCHRLFEKIRFADGIDAHEYERYRHANRWAARYCRRLERHFMRDSKILAELRRFYRMPKIAKIQRIGRSAAV